MLASYHAHPSVRVHTGQIRVLAKQMLDFYNKCTAGETTDKGSEGGREERMLETQRRAPPNAVDRSRRAEELEVEIGLLGSGSGSWMGDEGPPAGGDEGCE